MIQCRIVALVAALSFTVVYGQSISVTPDHRDGVYRTGETANWTVRADGISGDLTYAVMPGQGQPAATGKISATAHGETIQSRFDGPSTVLVKVVGKTVDGQEIVGLGGAVADADSIKPSAPRPDDFDAFWRDRIDRMRTLPLGVRLTPVASEVSNVDYYKVSLDHVGGSNVQGQLARPTKGEKFPAILQTQWAGVYGLDRHWVTDRAADGWLALNIQAHDLPIDEPADFYKKQADGPLKNYWAIGNDDRDTSYFLRMYLSCVRAIDYLKTRPDWDGRTLVVFGGSQGGQQALVTAALCEDITAAMANVPAGCDMLGPTVGRRGGWPQWYDWTRGVDWHTPLEADKVRQASRYFDVVNFAPGIRCPVLIGTGLVDEVCPAAGVLAAYNQIRSPKRMVLMATAAHQSVMDSHGAYDKLLWETWLPSLVKGKAVR